MRERFIVFPPFQLDLVDERLRQDGVVVELRPKTFAVLRHLLQHAGRLVTKSDLLDAVWADVAVTESVLKGCIAEIRAALGDDRESPRFVETAHRRGYRFIGAVARPGDGPAAESASAVFGREDALNRLDEAFATAGTGARQVVFVTGEPGIGKTTLVDRWLDRTGERHAGRIGRGECLEHCGAAEAYLPILDAVGRLCRDPGGEQIVGVLRRYAPTWLAQLPALLGDSEREELTRQLVGATPQRMLREMAEALEAMTATTPLVLVVEDLHWSDRSTLDLVAMLARRRETARLLVIGTYRAEDILSGGHPLKTIASELALHRHAVELALPPLSKAAAAQYLGARFPGHTLADGVASLIHQRSEGNPLFMVSLVDELERAGAIRMRDGAITLGSDVGRLSSEVPGSVTHVIERQLDRLSDDERRVVVAASVAGEEFAVPIVAAALEADVVQTERTCREVVGRKLLLVPGSPLTLPDGRTVPRFRFIHALYRQALHDAVPIVARAQLHGRLAVGLEALYGPHVNEVALELAVHFEAAEDWLKATTYFHRAAATAASWFANQEVVALTERGLAAVRRLPGNEARARELPLQMMKGAALMTIAGYAAPAVEEAYARARAICAELGNTANAFPVLWGLARFYLVRTPLGTSRALGEDMMRLAEHEQDPDLLLQAHNSLGATLFHMGECEAALVHFDRALALYDTRRHHTHVTQYVQDPAVVCLARSSLALWCLGDPDQAVRRAREGIALAESQAHSFSLAFALAFVAMLHEFRRDFAAARQLAERAIDLSAREGFSVFVTMGTLIRGTAIAELGDLEAGIDQIRSGMKAADAAGTRLLRPYSLGLLARACGQSGNLPEGLGMVAEALETAAATGEHFYDAELHRIEGALLLRSPRADARARAEASLRTAIRVAECENARAWRLRAATTLGELEDERGRASPP